MTPLSNRRATAVGRATLYRIFKIGSYESLASFMPTVSITNLLITWAFLMRFERPTGASRTSTQGGSQRQQVLDLPPSSYCLERRVVEDYRQKQTTINDEERQVEKKK